MTCLIPRDIHFHYVRLHLGPHFNKTGCSLAAWISSPPIMRGWGHPDFWLSRTELTLMTHNCSHISFGGCFMPIIRRWPRGSREAPPASLKVPSNGCGDYLGLFLWFSCTVIPTIRTAFLPEAFKEQLQKQIAAVVAAVVAAEKKHSTERQDKKRQETRQRPPPAHITQGEGRHNFSAEASESQLHQEK